MKQFFCLIVIVGGISFIRFLSTVYVNNLYFASANQNECI